jgi:hypothetical protein
MKMLAIFDNGGKTLDRYTVVFDKGNWQGSKFHPMLGLDNGGVGFSQFSEGQYNPKTKNAHLGKQIEFSTLSPETKGHILYRMGA